MVPYRALLSLIVCMVEWWEVNQATRKVSRKKSFLFIGTVADIYTVEVPTIFSSCFRLSFLPCFNHTFTNFGLIMNSLPPYKLRTLDPTNRQFMMPWTSWHATFCRHEINTLVRMKSPALTSHSSTIRPVETLLIVGPFELWFNCTAFSSSIFLIINSLLQVFNS